MKNFFNLICLLLITLFLYSCLDTKSEPFIPINKAPKIIEIKADKEIVKPDSTVRIIVKASDPEKMDSILVFEWISDAGKLTLTPDYIDTSKIQKAFKADTVFWKAPSAVGTYKITVSAQDNLNDKKDSSIILTVQENPLIPGVPHSPLPADNGLNLSSSVVLSWSCAGEPVRLLFDLYLGDENTLARIDSNLKVKSYKIDNLQYGKTYSWYIKAKYDNTKYSKPNKNWNFKIRDIATSSSNDELAWSDLIIKGIYINSPKLDTLKIENNYQIMKNEVTNKQYTAYLNVIKSSLKIVGDSLVYGFNDGDKNFAGGEVLFIDLKLAGIQHSNGNFSSNSNDLPVAGVSYYGAKYFALYYKCLLPSYKEWQVAALKNNKNHYPWGTNQIDSTFANYKSGKNERGRKPVNFYPKNVSPFGAVDMVGNVWEWTNSYFNKSYAVGGGSYVTVEAALPCNIFYYYNPLSIYSYIGFRCIRLR